MTERPTRKQVPYTKAPSEVCRVRWEEQAQLPQMALVLEERTEKAGRGEVLTCLQRAQPEQNARGGRCRVCKRNGRRPVYGSKGYMPEGGVRSGEDREVAPPSLVPGSGGPRGTAQGAVSGTLIRQIGQGRLPRDRHLPSHHRQYFKKYTCFTNIIYIVQNVRQAYKAHSQSHSPLPQLSLPTVSHWS